MIAFLRGNLLRIEASYIILDVGGVGYKVSVPVSALTSLPPVGQPAELHIHTNVREDEIALYGFCRPEEQRVFELLIGVTGIGPKVALSILSALDVDTLSRAVASEDTKTLIRIPGLGLKTAQRLVLELREKLAAFVLERKIGPLQQPAQKPPIDDLFGDVVEGLVNLGYNRNDARRATERALKESATPGSMAAMLRAALNILTGSGSKG
jgi:Holliday junction DNA helicase RuvA